MLELDRLEMEKLKSNVLTKEKVRKYLRLIQVQKVHSFTELSLQTGTMEDVLRDQLSVFDPMVRMFEDYDLSELINALEDFLQPSSLPSRKKVKRGKAKTYASIGDFVYQCMTIPGGIVDSSVDLDIDQLKALRKFVNAEIKAKK